MKEYVVCKSCGFIMEKGSLKDKCPACGVPAKMFEPYVEKVSPRRKLILSLDIHPILVHFPIAFNVTILIMAFLMLFIKGDLLDNLKTASTVLLFCLPYVVAFAFLAGLFDGQIRFKRVTTPILIKKIILGLIFFVLSVTGLILSQVVKLESASSVMLILAVSAGNFFCSVFLGLLGSSILNAKFPG